MRKRFTSIITVLALALMTLFVSCEQNTSEPLASSISVRVADQTGARTITPEGNVNISHYVISIHNDAENIHQDSGYLAKGAMFTVSNVPAGTWYAKVDAYVQRGEEGSYTYVKVASAQSEPKAVAAGSSTIFDLVLDTLDEVMSGDVTVTLKMPTALATQDTPFWYTYAITGMTDAGFTKTSELTQGATGADGLATITLDADTLGLLQGAYRFEITVQDAESNPTLTRKGVDVMRLINGLEAKGTIDLATYESDQSFDMTITDKIGDILTPSIQDGQEIYELNSETGNTLTVTLTEPLKANETIEWYVDGEVDGTVNTDNATSGQYTLTFTNGKHSVTAIIRDTDTQISVGSVSFLVKNTSIDFSEHSIFTFELNEDGQSYTLTGVRPEALPLKDINIPSYYKGLPVTEIGELAFQSNELKETFPQTYKTYLIQVAKQEAGYEGSDAKEAYNIILEFFKQVIELDPGTATTMGITLENVEDYVDDMLSFYSVQLSIQSIQPLEISGNIYIPETVTKINLGAFAGLTLIDSVEFRDNSQSKIIEPAVFMGCTSLSNITIPESVVSIGTGAFLECSALETVEISDASQLTSIETSAFNGCSALKSINIPDGVTSIKSFAFNECSALETVEISDASQLTLIGDAAFQSCYVLREINIPAGVNTIGTNVFSGCSSLSEINIPDGMTSIRTCLFQSCSALTSITIPDSVTEIGFFAFQNCDALTDIYFESTEQSVNLDEDWLGNCKAQVHWGYSNE